ncbi:protein DpdD [Paraburkholderia domus]|uniref:Uncharacterized protein n=1 Tax=Paraburkholderia domus TaxID=2793075 RepID=A0A9N8MKI2_9BURK|nr:protein DpdD [Paraburkholderia domus]MBK5163795.1 hypothetical protein [Burkholderia sp. R-70211]CAE6858552.1 hypothetical protein R70211_00317 [Paraburkholderia domus]
MMDILHPDEDSWLKLFFSGRNALHWDDIVDAKAPAAWLEQVVPWINAFAAPDVQLPIVLPVFDADGPCQWYGMATDDASAVALAQELAAAVGPSYSDFRGQPLQKDSDDEIECGLRDRFGRFIFRFGPVDAAQRNDVSQALQLYLGLLRRRPVIPDRTQRPFGRIRAEFDSSLLVGNETDAHRLRDELIASGRVDSEQQKYLEIRMLAGLGRQHQLAHDYSLIKSVQGLSLPPQIIADLVGALYSTYVTDIEDDLNVDKVLSAFRNDIARPFGPLFQERKGIRQPNVLKAFLLFELTQDTPNVARCEAIAAAYPEHTERSLVDRWINGLTSVPSAALDKAEMARQALGDEDYELALQLSFEACPEAWTYSAMLRCAVELEDKRVILRILEEVKSASADIRNGWSKRDLARLQQLEAESSEALVKAHLRSQVRPEADWLSWADYVLSGRYDRHPLQILEAASARWNVELFVADPKTCRELAERIGNASGDAEEVFRDAFPALVEFFADRPAHPVRGFIPLYSMLIRIVAWSGTVSANELELAAVLMQALIGLGASKEDYVEALDAFVEVLSANNAPSNIDWALNAAETLALHASPDHESRLRFFTSVVEVARVHAHRLNPAQYAVLSLLAKDYGCVELLESFPSQADDHAETLDAINFTGLIGIYTLTEPAGQRARQFLQKLLPLSRIELNADFAATDKLKHLAATADIFVFAWKSSKHQAYYAAKEARGNRQTLLPLGKGSASILDCVFKELRRLR